MKNISFGENSGFVKTQEGTNKKSLKQESIGLKAEAESEVNKQIPSPVEFAGAIKKLVKAQESFLKDMQALYELRPSNPLSTAIGSAEMTLIKLRTTFQDNSVNN